MIDMDININDCILDTDFFITYSTFIKEFSSIFLLTLNLVIQKWYSKIIPALSTFWNSSTIISHKNHRFPLFYLSLGSRIFLWFPMINLPSRSLSHSQRPLFQGIIFGVEFQSSRLYLPNFLPSSLRLLPNLDWIGLLMHNILGEIPEVWGHSIFFLQGFFWSVRLSIA